MAEGYGDGRVQINEKSFGGKRYLKEILGTKCSMKCSVGRSQHVAGMLLFTSLDGSGWVWPLRELGGLTLEKKGFRGYLITLTTP